MSSALSQDERQADEELEKKLLAALDEGYFQEVTPEFFRQLRVSVVIGHE